MFPTKKRSAILGFALVVLVVAALIVLFRFMGRETAEDPGGEPPVPVDGGGWVSLFDGATLAGWRGLGLDRVPEGHWAVEDGAVKKIPTADVPLQADGQPRAGGDLMTVESFEDFELLFEWKISPGGNSGLKYNVSEDMSLALNPNRAALGFEYQILDDERHPDAANGPHRKAGSLYDLIAPAGGGPKPVGEFNSGGIVFRGGHGEHWLNGVKVLEYDLGTPQMNERLAESKYRDIAGFGDKRRGHIVLQDHTDAAWFRAIRIRLPSRADGQGQRRAG